MTRSLDMRSPSFTNATSTSSKSDSLESPAVGQRSQPTVGSVFSPLPFNPRSRSAFSPSLPTPNTNAKARSSLNSDAITDAIFQALFGSASAASTQPSKVKPGRRWDDVDSDSDSEGEQGGQQQGTSGNSLNAYAGPVVPKVDEAWFKRLLTTNLLTSAAIDFAVNRTVQYDVTVAAGAGTGAADDIGSSDDVSSSKPAPLIRQVSYSGRDVLHQYITPEFVRTITKVKI